MDLFIARQPIFTASQNLFGYELLFRSGPVNAFPEIDATHASARVMADTLFHLGVRDLTGGTRAFINFTRDLLVGGYAALLPKDETVVEVVESVTADAPVVAACAGLKGAGYRLALDNFRDPSPQAPLVALADFLTVDFLATPRSERAALVTRYAGRGLHFLAAKVETPAAFQEARKLGYEYFQGYFFAKPAVLRTTGAPECRLTYLTLLQAVMQPDIDVRRVATLIGRDVTLSYKLFRYINSAFFGLRRTIASIPEAIGLLGERELRRWVSLVNLAALGTNKPAELVVEAAVRARFCEQLALEARLGHLSEECFLLGLCLPKTRLRRFQVKAKPSMANVHARLGPAGDTTAHRQSL